MCQRAKELRDSVLLVEGLFDRCKEREQPGLAFTFDKRAHVINTWVCAKHISVFSWKDMSEMSFHGQESLKQVLKSQITNVKSKC